MYEVDPNTLPPAVAREHQAYRLRDAASFLRMAADCIQDANRSPGSSAAFAAQEKAALDFANLNIKRARALGKRAEEK